MGTTKRRNNSIAEALREFSLPPAPKLPQDFQLPAAPELLSLASVTFPDVLPRHDRLEEQECEHLQVPHDEHLATFAPSSPSSPMRDVQSAKTEEFFDLYLAFQRGLAEKHLLMRLLRHGIKRYKRYSSNIDRVLSFKERLLKELHLRLGPQVHMLTALVHRVSQTCKRVRAEQALYKAQMEEIMFFMRAVENQTASLEDRCSRTFDILTKELGVEIGQGVRMSL